LSEVHRECRFCFAALRRSFVDLGVSPVSNDLLEFERLDAMEPFYPLHAFVCERCLLVQIPAFHRPEQIFTADYAYFSSVSTSWLERMRAYAEGAIRTFALGANDLVVELASNDGYLLQYFVKADIPVLGIEPAANVAQAAIARGIRTEVAFFGTETARRVLARYGAARLLVANNVLAHVPDLNDFVGGIALLLARDGVATIEVPHLESLIDSVQFDTIYHEHFSYFSLGTLQQIFAAHGLALIDAERTPTHGGSLRISVARAATPATSGIEEILSSERARGMDRIEGYSSFQSRVERVKHDLLRFLLEARSEGRSVAAYAAAAKGTTLLNYCGIRSDFIDFVADLSPRKQGRYVPGVRIPIVGPERLREVKPDYILVLAWNILPEIREQLGFVREWGGRFVVAIPTVSIVEAVPSFNP